MTGKPRVPHGGSHGGSSGGHGGDGHPHEGSGHPEGGKKPSTTHGSVDASKSVSSAHESISETAQKGRPGQGQEHTTPTTTATTPTKPNFENPAFDDRKLTEYALNPDHPVGGNKAKVIESVTGLTKSDAAAVKQQILDQVKHGGDPIPGKVDEHGSRFAKDVTLTGPNGTIVVRTAWIVDANTGETRLATVSFPPKAKK